jgi:hypothetical protein
MFQWLLLDLFIREMGALPLVMLACLGQFAALSGLERLSRPSLHPLVSVARAAPAATD